MKLPIFGFGLVLSLSVHLAEAQSFVYLVGDTDHDSLINPGTISYKSDIAFIDEFRLAYNPISQQLDFSATYTANSEMPQGFWFVLGDGPNPKDGGGDHPIFYFDASGDSGGAIISAYIYNGQNGASSHLETDSFLASSETSSTLTAAALYFGQQANFTFTADLSGINSAPVGPDWKGGGFGEEVGIWFHSVTFKNAPEYNPDGSLKVFDLQSADFFDVANGSTVPEPSAALLSLLGAAILLRRKR